MWAEIAASLRFRLELVDENLCDAYATAETGVIPEGTPVEVKACCVWIGNGTYRGTDARMRGRFTFSPTHQQLVEAEGWYALVLYDTVDDPPPDEGDERILVYRVALVSASTIDALLGSFEDTSNYPKLGWPHIFHQRAPP